MKPRALPPPPAEGSVLSLDITGVAYGGRGIGRTDGGYVVFVPGALAGERVEAVLRRNRGNHADAELRCVIAASPARVTPSCPLAGACPGCRYQHVRYEEELRLKQAQFEELFARMAGVRDPGWLPPVPSPLELGYRNKITLHAARGPDGVALGYFSEDNASVLDVPACPLAAAPINRRLAELRADPAFLAGLRDHQVLSLRWTPADGALHWMGRWPAGSDGEDSARWLTEDSRLGALRVPAGCFYQVNRDAADLLLGAVMDLFRDAAPRRVVDLYCGVGVFALAAAALGVPEVFGADSDALAIRAAAHNAAARGLSGVRFLAAPARGALREPVCGRAADALLVVDPPRTGLTRDLPRRIAALRFPEIVYVSCAADTLARDVRALADCGYGVRSVQLVDLFPRTPYFESVTRLRAATARGART